MVFTHDHLDGRQVLGPLVRLAGSSDRVFQELGDDVEEVARHEGEGLRAFIYIYIYIYIHIYIYIYV